jgi:hypothetical protein
MKEIVLWKFFARDHLQHLGAVSDFNPGLQNDAQQHLVEVCVLVPRVRGERGD